MEMVKQDFFEGVRLVDMNGVEELGVDGVAVAGFLVENGEVGMLENQEFVRVFDQVFGAAVAVTGITLVAKAPLVGDQDAKAAADRDTILMPAGGGSVEAMADSVATDGIGVSAQNFGYLGNIFAFS